MLPESPKCGPCWPATKAFRHANGRGSWSEIYPASGRTWPPRGRRRCRERVRVWKRGVRRRGWSNRGGASIWSAVAAEELSPCGGGGGGVGRDGGVRRGGQDRRAVRARGSGQTVRPRTSIDGEATLELLAEAIVFSRPTDVERGGAAGVGGGLAGSTVAPAQGAPCGHATFKPASGSRCTTRTWASSPARPAKPAW